MIWRDLMGGRSHHLWTSHCRLDRVRRGSRSVSRQNYLVHAWQRRNYGRLGRIVYDTLEIPSSRMLQERGVRTARIQGGTEKSDVS